MKDVEAVARFALAAVVLEAELSPTVAGCVIAAVPLKLLLL